MPAFYSIHFYFNRMLHRMEMWEKAETKLLQTIELDSASIIWTKKNRELIVNNEYFDVVSISYHTGKALLKGIFDHEETKMHEAFAQKQNRDTEPGNTPRKIADWLLMLWTFEDNPYSNDLIYPFAESYTLARFCFIINKGKQPPVPPPWLI